MNMSVQLNGAHLTDDSRGVAYHEVGHAVAALLCGERVLAVQCAHRQDLALPDWHARNGCCSGLCETGMRPLKTEAVHRLLEQDSRRWWPIAWAKAVNFTFFCGAGVAAEAKIRGFGLERLALSQVEHHAADLQRALYAFEAFEEDPTEREDLVWRMWERAAATIAHPAIWQAVCVIAQQAVAKPNKPVRLDGATIDARFRAYVPDLPLEPLTSVVPSLREAAAFL